MTKLIAVNLFNFITIFLPFGFVYLGIDEKWLNTVVSKNISDVNSYILSFIGLAIWGVRIYIQINRFLLEKKEREANIKIKLKENNLLEDEKIN